MPAKGKTKLTPRQRNAIAQGKLTGKKSKDIAKDAGIAVSTVRNQAHDPRTVTQILTLKQQSEVEFAKMWRDMVTGVAKDIIDTDFSTRQSARVLFLRMLTAGDPPLHRVGDMGSTAGDFTLEEMLVTLRRVTIPG